MSRDDTFWGRIGQLALDSAAVLAAGLLAAPVALMLAIPCFG